MTGDVLQEDDKSIPDTDRLFRRIGNTVPNQIVEVDGAYRPSSAYFKHLRLSVNIEFLMIAQGRPPEDTLKNYPDENLVAISAGKVREFGYPIVIDNDHPKDPAHGLILGKKTDKFAAAMSRDHFEWIVAPRLTKA